MKVMLKRTLLIALLALTMLGLLAIGVGAAAMEGSYADDTAAIAGGAVAKITDGGTTAYYAKVADALDAVADGQTITLLDVTGTAEGSTEIDFDKDISFTITGTAPNYALPIVTFTNATVTFENAEILTAELDARQDATINVKNTIVHMDASSEIVKSYFNGAINISGNSVVHTMQLTTMGYITLSDTAQLNATWQINVLGNGLITVKDDAVLAAGALQLTGDAYNDRDNTDADRVGKPATIVVDGGTLIVGEVYAEGGSDYSYNAAKYGINIGTIEGKSALLDIKNGGTVVLKQTAAGTAGYTYAGVITFGAGANVRVSDSTLQATCQSAGGKVTVTNSGTVYVTGTSDISGTFAGSGWVYMDTVSLDADTVMYGARVGFINGINTIVGSIIDDGWFSVGIGKDSLAATAAAFAAANGITMGDVTVNVSGDAIIGTGTDAAYSGWIGSAYSADKTVNKYVLNVENSMGAFGYLHISADGALNVNGAATNKTTDGGTSADFYVGDFIINGTATFEDCYAWAKGTKVSVDHENGALTVANGATYEACWHNGGNASTTLQTYGSRVGTIIVDNATLDITGVTTVNANSTLNALNGAAVIVDGKFNNNGTLTIADSALTSSGVIANAGALKIDIDGSVTASAITGEGTITVDATGIPFNTTLTVIEQTSATAASLETVTTLVIPTDAWLSTSSFENGDVVLHRTVAASVTRDEVTTYYETLEDTAAFAVKGDTVCILLDTDAEFLFVKGITVTVAVGVSAPNVGNYVATITVGGNTTYYRTFEDAVMAANGNTITLAHDITTGGPVTITNLNVNLNGYTMFVTKGDIYMLGEATLRDGTIDITGCVASGNGIFNIGNYSNNATLNLINVDLIGDGYNSAFGVLLVYGNGALNVTGGEWDLANEQYSAGGVIKNESGAGSPGMVNITGTTMNFENVERGLTGCTAVLDDVDLTIKGGDNGINGTTLTVQNGSTIDISGGTGRGITVTGGDITIIDSTVTVSDNGEGDILFRSANTVSVEGTSSLTADTVLLDESYDVGQNGTPVTDLIEIGEDATTNIYYAAQIGGTCYKTFAEALAAAVAGDTIMLLDNLTIDQAIVIATDIAIDGKNFTITSNATGSVFMLNASLEINNVAIINNVASAPAFLLGDDVDLTVGANTAVNSAIILGGYDEVGHTHKVTVGNIALSSALEAEGFYMVNNGDGTYIVSEHAVAKIGNTLYHSLQDALDAAQPGDTIIILQNIELTETVAITKNLTFSGNFTLLSSSADVMFSLADGVALTINCEVESTAPNGVILGNWNGQTVKTNNAVVRDLLNAEGYAMVEETTGVWTVKAAKAAIGSMNYASLADALAAVQNNETIVLLADAELTAPAIIDKTITISGNYTVTSSAATTFVVSGNLTLNCNNVNTYATGSLVSLANGATVAINGTATANKLLSGYDVALHTVTTTVESVATTLNGEGYALVKTDSTWKVMTDKPEASVDGWHYVTVEDAIAVGGTVTLLRDVTVEATVNVTGDLAFTGSYTLTSTAATAFKLADGATLAINCKLDAADVLDATGAWTVTTAVKAIAEQLNGEGYSLVLSDGVYTITSNSPQVSVDGWNYDTMKNAILDLKNGKFSGSVLRLLKDFSHSAADIDIYTDLTIYGDGYTMTSTASTAIRVYGCTVTFENFKLVSSGDAIVLRDHENDSHVVINNSTIDANKVGLYVYAVKGGSAIIKGNTVINAGKTKNTGYALQSYCSDTPITVQDNVALNSALTLAIYFNGTSADIGSAKLIIKDNVTLSSNTVHQMAISENSVNSTWDFSNWNTYKAYAYVKNSNKYQIFGFYTTLKIALEADAISHSETVTNTIYLLGNTTDFGGATVSKPVIIDGNGYSITVADGKTAFTLGADCTSLALNNVSINGNILAGFAAGKTVTTNMEAIANALNAQGYALHKEGDIWTVAGLGVVSLNGWNYATIQEALGLIKNGESLNVLIDFTTDATAVIDKSITIYGNNKKITSTAGVAIQISNTVTINDLTLYASGVGIKTADGPVDPIVINLNDCTIGDSAKPIGSHGIQFQYLIVDVTLNMTNSTVYAVGRGVHSDMAPARTVNINIKMDTLDTTNPTICSTGNNGLSFHYANDANVTLENVYIKAKGTAFGASQHDQNNAANPKIVVASATNCKFESTSGTAVGMNMDKGNINNRFIADITLTNCTISGVTHGVILDGSTTEHGASKLTISGGSVSCTATGIHLRGDVTASISNVSVTSTGGWAIYTEQTGDTANTVPYINLTVTNCTLSGLGGIRFSAAADATRGNSKLTVSGGTITATGAYNAKIGETAGTDDKPSYVGIFASGAADVAVSNATISAPSTTGIHFWQGCNSANLTLTNTHVGTADKLIGRLGIYVYQSNAAEVNITLINSTVAATNIAIKVNGKAAQTANITVTNNALDSVNPTLYSSGAYAISANWACDLRVALTNAYLKSKDSGIYLTQHNTNLTNKDPKILSGTITGCLIESLNSNAINVYTPDTTDATKKPMFGLQLTVTDSTLKAKNAAVLLSAYEGLEGNYLNLNGNTRLEGDYGLFLRGVGGYITVTATKSDAGALTIVATTSAVYIDSTLGVTFTADGGSITSTSGAAIYRQGTNGAVTTVVALTDVALSSDANWAIDLYQQDFTDDDHKVDVTMTNCTVTGAYGVRVAGYELGTAANTSGYALQITGGSISTTNDVLAIEGIYALVKDATLTFAGTGSSNRGVYMQSNTSHAPKLVLDNTTLTYKRTDGQAIYLANNGSNTVVLQNNAKIESKAIGINTGSEMFQNTIEVINSSIEAAGLYGIKFNAKNYQTGILTLVLNGGTIKTTASVADDVAAAQNILPHAINIREGIVEITSPANSAKNYILAEGNRGVAIFVDRYTGNLDMTLYNTEIKSDSHVFSFGASTAIMGSDIPYLDNDSKEGTANVTLYNSTVTSAEASAVFALLSQKATLNFTVSGTNVTAAADAFYISGKGSFTLGATGGEITSTGAASVYVNLTEATCTATVTLNGTDVTTAADTFFVTGKGAFNLTGTNGSSVTSTANRGIYVEKNVVPRVNLTDTTVHAHLAAVEYCIWGNGQGYLTVKMTDKNVDARTGENADIYSETYRALNFRSGSNYTLDLDNVSVCAGTQAVYRTRPDGGGTVWLNAEFTNCNLTSTNNSWVVWVGDGYNPSHADVTWAFNLTFDDCKFVGGGGIIATARTSVKSSLTMTDCTVDANTTLGISLCGYLDAELTRVDVKAYKNKTANDTGAFRVHYDSSVANISMTDVRIWNYGVGTSPKAMLVSNGENHLTAHNLELYAEGTGGQGLYWHGIPEPTGKNDNSVEITGKLVIRSVEQALLFNPKSGGTLKIHLDSGDGRTKATPDIKSTNSYGIHLITHTTQSYDVLFTLDLKNVYVESKGNGFHRSNDKSTLTGTIDQCRFVSTNGAGLYFTNNGGGAIVLMDNITIKNTNATGKNYGFITSSPRVGDKTGKLTFINCNIHGNENNGMYYSGIFTVDIQNSTVTVGKPGVWVNDSAAIRIADGGAVITMNIRDSRVEHLGAGKLGYWDDPDNKNQHLASISGGGFSQATNSPAVPPQDWNATPKADGTWSAATGTGAYAVYVSNGVVTLNIYDSEIISDDELGVGINRSGNKLNYTLYVEDSEIRAGFNGLNWGENNTGFFDVTLKNSTVTVENGCGIRINGTNANTTATITLIDSTVTTNGTSIADDKSTSIYNEAYEVRAIRLVDGSFTLNIQGNSEVIATDAGTNAIVMGAGAGKLKFNMTGGLISSAKEGIEINSGAGGIDFDMTGGRVFAEGSVAIRLRPGAGTNTVDIKMDALNTETPNIEATGSFSHAIYCHNAANISFTLENAYLRATESNIHKTDPYGADDTNQVYTTLTITATKCKLETVGHAGDNSGYTIFRIADEASRKSYIISQITLTDCEMINSAQRSDGSSHGFRIDAAEGSFLKIYGGSLSVPHTAFRFREWANVTIGISELTGDGAYIYAGAYLIDPNNNDTYAMPTGVTELNYTMSFVITGATLVSDGTGLSIVHSANRNISELTISLTDTNLTANGGTAINISIKGEVDITLTRSAIVAGDNGEGLRFYSSLATSKNSITLTDTTVEAGLTALNPDTAGDVILRISMSEAYGSTPALLSHNEHGIHFQSNGYVEMYLDNVYIYAGNTGLYRSSNPNKFVGVMNNSKLESPGTAMRISLSNTDTMVYDWTATNSEFVGITYLGGINASEYNFIGCTFYNDNESALVVRTKGVVNLKDCTLTSDTHSGIFVDNQTIPNTNVTINVEDSTIYALDGNAILVDNDLIANITLRNVIASASEAVIYMNGSYGSTLTIVSGAYQNFGTAGFTIDILGDVVTNIYGGYFGTTSQGVLRARDYAVMNVYGGHYEMEENEYHTQWTGVIRLGTDKGAGKALVNVYGGTFEAPESLYSVFNVNRGRGINLYSFNVIGGQYIMSTNNSAKITMEYATDKHVYQYNNAEMVDGAQVRLVLTENTNAGGIRFVTNIDADTLNYAKWLADDAASISYGTVIAPLDYIQMLPAFTVELLQLAGMDYLDIVAKNGIIENEDGSITLRAVINEIQEHNYDRVFAAIAYVKVTVDGEDVYLYSAFDEETNARSLKQLAERALADVIAFQTSAYRFPVGDGTYSRYTDEQRAALTRILNCQYNEEVIIEPTEDTPGLKKVWCDVCGTYYEVLIPATGHYVSISVGKND